MPPCRRRNRKKSKHLFNGTSKSRSLAIPSEPVSFYRGGFPYLNRLRCFSGSHRILFTTLPRTKPIEINECHIEPASANRGRIATPLLGALTIRYRQRRAIQTASSRKPCRQMWSDPRKFDDPAVLRNALLEPGFDAKTPPNHRPPASG